MTCPKLIEISDPQGTQDRVRTALRRMRTIKLQLPPQLNHLFLLHHQLPHQSAQVFSCHTNYFIRIFSCMLGRRLLSVFFRSYISIICSQLLLLLVVSTQPERLLSGSAFLANFIIFGSAFGLQVSVSFLKRTKYGDIIRRLISLPGLIFLLIRLQFDRILLLLRLQMMCFLLSIHLSFLFDQSLQRNFDILDSRILSQSDVDRRSMRFIDRPTQ